MYPYLHIGTFQLGTFGLLLWLAAVAGTAVLHWNFERFRIQGDAINIVALAVVAGIVGAKAWHELQDVPELMRSLQFIGQPGWSQPIVVLGRFLHWFQAGFAWYGGMLAAVATLMLQGRTVHFAGPTIEKPGPSIGAFRMLDLAAPAAAIGYGVGRLGCLTSGDGDYGRNTTSWIGVHMRPDALVPVHPADALVLPTPLFELAGAVVIGMILWRLGAKPRVVGWLTGLYLILSGVARFIVEFWRINPQLYWGLSNAQVAAVCSVLLGMVWMAVAIARKVPWRTPASAPVAPVAA